MKHIQITLLSILVLFSSCKKFMDVGTTNPNVAQNPDLNYILPSAELFICHTMGYNLQVVGGIWSQYWTQSPNSSQYKVMDQYSVPASFYDRPWSNMYAGALMDLSQIENKARDEGKNDYVAISLLLQAYSYQVLTDAFGDIPYTQALKSNSELNFSPTYDSQAVVYAGIKGKVDEAISLIEGIIANGEHTFVGNDDLFYHGDLEQWWYFANTLKLKLALRWSEANPSLAQDWITELEDGGAEFIGQSGKSAVMNYTTSAGNRNPLYENIVGLSNTQNLWGSSTCIDSMVSNADKRVNKLYTAAGGNYVGIPQGSYGTLSAIANGSKSLPSGLTGGLSNNVPSGQAPVYLISKAEGLLLMAEAIARGWLTGDAKAAYEKAIDESFLAVGLTSADATAYIASSYWGTYPTSGNLTEKLKYIITQKWFTMCGSQGFEAWTEWRRTGYPNFFVLSQASQIGSNFPQRCIYPSSEISTNSNFPGQQLVYTKVPWDVN